MSGFEPPPGLSSWTPAGSSPSSPPPMGPPRSSAKGTPAGFPPKAAPPEEEHPCSGSSAQFKALQEHMSILRKHLVDAEKDLDRCDPEEYDHLEKALRRVSGMITQIENTADVLTVRNRNLTNELITLIEEKAHLKDALFEVRTRKLIGMTRSTTPNVTTKSGRKRPSSASSHYCDDTMKERAHFLAQQVISPGAAGNEDDSLVETGKQDDGAGATTLCNVPSSPGGSGATKCPLEESSDSQAVMSIEMRPASAKKRQLSQSPTAKSTLPQRFTREYSASASPQLTTAVLAPGLGSLDPSVNRASRIQQIPALDEPFDINDLQRFAGGRGNLPRKNHGKRFAERGGTPSLS